MNNDIIRQIIERISRHKETIAHLQNQSRIHPELFMRTIARHKRDINELQIQLKKISQ
jgi:hypothetical protein